MGILTLQIELKSRRVHETSDRATTDCLYFHRIPRLVLGYIRAGQSVVVKHCVIYLRTVEMTRVHGMNVDNAHASWHLFSVHIESHCQDRTCKNLHKYTPVLTTGVVYMQTYCPQTYYLLKIQCRSGNNNKNKHTRNENDVNDMKRWPRTKRSFKIFDGACLGFILCFISYDITSRHQNKHTSSAFLNIDATRVCEHTSQIFLTNFICTTRALEIIIVHACTHLIKQLAAQTHAS